MTKLVIVVGGIILCVSVFFLVVSVAGLFHVPVPVTGIYIPRSLHNKRTPLSLVEDANVNLMYLRWGTIKK